jgi:hypothetical protein
MKFFSVLAAVLPLAAAVALPVLEETKALTSRQSNETKIHNCAIVGQDDAAVRAFFNLFSPQDNS